MDKYAIKDMKVRRKSFYHLWKKQFRYIATFLRHPYFLHMTYFILR